MITDLYDAVVKAFRAYSCPAVVFLGEQYRAQHTTQLRVVMWQGADSPADVFTPQLAASLLPSQRLQFVSPRPVATRVCGFSVELWATAPTQRNQADQFRANQAFLDALVNQFVVAMQQISSGIFEIQSGRAAAGNAAAAVSGLGYTMLCACQVPIIDAKWPAQQLSECSQTWQEATATAEIEIREGNTSSPVFQVPTP